MINNEAIARQLSARQEKGLLRQRRLLTVPQGVRCVIDGKPCVSFSSNDYLNLTTHPEVIAACEKGLKKYGVGVGSSQLIAGYSSAHHHFEKACANFMGYERALIFSSGYMANLAVMTTLMSRRDLILGDYLNHASLIDGATFSEADFKRYRHNDMAHLRDRLEQSSAVQTMIATDGVFSMDGDLANLPELHRLAKNKNVLLMLDDAHGFGVLGKKGRGTLEYYGMSSVQIPLLSIPMGKAFGCSGGLVLGRTDLIEAMLQLARPYIYTTAIPPAICVAALKSLELIQLGVQRKKLNENIKNFRAIAEKFSLPILDSITAIQPLIIGDTEKAKRLSQFLFDQGIYVKAIVPPTVPLNKSRLRITLTANHSVEQISQLIETIARGLNL